MRAKIFIGVILILIAFVGCEKDEHNSPQTLISKIWERGLVDKNPSTNPEGDVVYYAVKDCEKDNTFKFDIKGELIVNKNDKKCNPNELQIETQNYSINRAENKLIINGIEYTLAEESKSQIKYYSTIPTGTGNEYLIFLLQ